MFETVWIIRGLIGGMLIGLAASLLLIANGRVAGISGILNQLMVPVRGVEFRWRLLFVVGLIVGGLIAQMVVGGAESLPPSLGTALVAGVLVGSGTRLANGCTSGHGVCGLSRLSVRSLVATVTFIATGALAVWLSNRLGG
ncbi:MAG: YeeE/YedE thiosulfate transporter family protein [Sandaracinaceae bacterium]|nr:YeeE/YedE thiosulfate transporter family protein [Sandaracinaceae bacterium]